MFVDLHPAVAYPLSIVQPLPLHDDSALHSPPISVHVGWEQHIRPLPHPLVPEIFLPDPIHFAASSQVLPPAASQAVATTGVGLGTGPKPGILSIRTPMISITTIESSIKISPATAATNTSFPWAIFCGSPLDMMIVKPSPQHEKKRYSRSDPCTVVKQILLHKLRRICGDTADCCICSS